VDTKKLKNSNKPVFGKKLRRKINKEDDEILEDVFRKQKFLKDRL